VPLGLTIPPWTLENGELTPHCISQSVWKHIQKTEPYNAQKQMSLVAAECKKAGTSRRFMELLHTKVTSKTCPEFSNKLKLILMSSPKSKFEPTYLRHIGESTDSVLNNSRGFLFGGKRKAAESENSPNKRDKISPLF
jgi:hypothetical protein